MNNSNSISNTSREDVVEQAERFFEILDSSGIVKSKTLHLIQRADEKGLLEQCTPVGGAAGAIYIACILNKLHVTQNILSEAAGISSSVIRKHYMLLARGLELKKD